MHWTCDRARAQYEEIQGRLAQLTQRIEKAVEEASELEIEASKLIGRHTLPIAGSYGN